MAQHLVEALDHPGVARRPLQLREADDDAKADEEEQDEHGARCQSLKGSDDDFLQFASAHAIPPLRLACVAGTS
jgi:hypothetical protein